MRKNTALITILLLAVIAAAALSLRVFFAEKAPEALSPTPPPAPTPPAATAQTLPPVESETLPTDTPSPTGTPEPAPSQTPEPTPTPTPTTLPVSASGSFASDTGTGLNLVADWSAYTDGSGAAKLRVELSARSYSFYTDAIWNALELTVNGTTYSASSAAVRYDGADMVVTPLASFTVDAPEGGADLTATWHYRGSYSGIPLEDITAAGRADY